MPVVVEDGVENRDGVRGKERGSDEQHPADRIRRLSTGDHEPDRGDDRNDHEQHPVE
ncbi:MAG TPA: hypothetical protein VFG00_03155 [Acidothermaceae bacterium]|nr:hypothetical protein [Acidothermaceae bacterium]